MSAPLWQPSPERIAGANLAAFMARVERDWGVTLAGYDALYDWSLAELEKFWSSVWDFCGVIAETRGEIVLCDPGAMVFRGKDKARATAWPASCRPARRLIAELSRSGRCSCSRSTQVLRRDAHRAPWSLEERSPSSQDPSCPAWICLHRRGQ